MQILGQKNAEKKRIFLRFFGRIKFDSNERRYKWLESR